MGNIDKTFKVFNIIKIIFILIVSVLGCVILFNYLFDRPWSTLFCGISGWILGGVASILYEKFNKKEDESNDNN